MKENNIQKAKPVALKLAIAYSKNSIVSKTLLDQKTGTLTLFAFDKGQALSEHTAPFDAVVQILDGQALLEIGGKIVVASSGTLVIMPAGVPHAVKAPKRFKMLLTMIRS
ncbi:MAG: cupin domain-containing protein [Candidatus Omnitrophota bacterium]